MVKSLKYTLFSIFLIFVVMTNVMAKDIENNAKLTIDDCIEVAISKNPNITLGKNISNIYKSKSGQVKSAYFPQINLSSGYNRQNAITNSNNDDSTNQYSGNASVNQLLYDFGKTSSKSRIQNLNYDSSRFDVENTIVQVVYNVKQAYYSALSAKINKNIYSQSIKLNEQHLKQAKAFFEAGLKSKIDVTTAEVNLSNAKLNFIKADNIYKNTIANLNNAMGVPEAPNYLIVDTLTFKNFVNEIKISNKHSKSEKQTIFKTDIAKNSIIYNLTLKKYDINLKKL
jgi:outer membrane protein TolC